MKKAKLLWMAAVLLLPGSRVLAGEWICQNQSNSLLRVVFLDTLKGCAVGANGTIIHTIDGGKTWVFQKGGIGSELLAEVCFVDSLRGWIGGQRGTILHTRDGGKHWEKQESGTSRDLYGVTFKDTSNGWAVGEYETILHTTDGGGTGLPK